MPEDRTLQQIFRPLRIATEELELRKGKKEKVGPPHTLTYNMAVYRERKLHVGTAERVAEVGVFVA
jgi:hypothetical protein